MNRIRNYLYKKDGTITLFAALSMTFLIIFFMVLIDISRLLLFSKVTESSTKLAAKSVMSAYDYFLYEKYGLFGRGGTEGQQLADYYMRDNIKTEWNMFGFTAPIQLVPIEIEQVEVFYDHYLGEYDELDNQISEEMKYKAPIDFSLDIIDSFIGLKHKSEQAKSVVSSMNTLQQLFEQREEAITQLFKLQQAVVKLEQNYPLDQQFSTITSGYSSYLLNVQALNALNDEIEAIIKDTKRNLTKQQAKTIEQLTSQLQSTERAINEYLTQSNKNLLQSEKNQVGYIEQLVVLQQTIEETFNLARTLNTTIAIQYDMLLMKQQSVQSDNPASVSSTSETIPPLDMDLSSEGLVRAPSFFTQYEQELVTQLNRFNQYAKEATNFISAMYTALNQPNINQSSPYPFELSYASYLNKRNVLYSHYISPGTVLQQRQLQNSDLNNIKDTLKQNSDKYKQLLNSSNYLTSLVQINDQLQKDSVSFDEVQKLFARNMERNNEQEETNLVEFNRSLTENGNKNAEQSLGQFVTLLTHMSTLGEQLQTHLYRNEYIIQRFQHLPLGELNQLTPIQKENINFHSQAVEYIMLGYSEPSANMSIVLAEIFAMRLAIRTIEGLIAYKHLANPVLIISTAVLYGLEHALLDMKQLLTKGKMELSKYAKLEISYRHYLRLLLSIHGVARKQTLSRIVAVIEHDLGLDLMQVGTSSIVVTKSRTTLWMLPSVHKMLSLPLVDSVYAGNGYYEKVDYASNSY